MIRTLTVVDNMGLPPDFDDEEECVLKPVVVIACHAHFAIKIIAIALKIANAFAKKIAI